jgi:hypothetical protein
VRQIMATGARYASPKRVSGSVANVAPAALQTDATLGATVAA